VCHCFGGERHEDWERRYFRDYWLRDESIPRIATLPDSRLVHTMDPYSDREKKTSTAYESRRAAGMHNGLNVRMDGPDGSNVVWILGNSTHREGWNSAQIETIERLLPCVRRFAHGRQLPADAGALGKSITELLDNTRFAVIQLDRHGRIVAANNSARRFLMRGDVLADSRGFLRAARPAEDAGFQRLLAKALPPFGLRSSAGSTTLGRSGSRTRLLVHIMPMMDRESAFRTSRVAALVLVADPEREARIDPGLRVGCGREALEACDVLVRDFGSIPGQHGILVEWRAMGSRIHALVLEGEESAALQVFRKMCDDLDVADREMIGKIVWDTIDLMAAGATPGRFAEALTDSVEDCEPLVPLLAALQELAGQPVRAPEGQGGCWGHCSGD